MCRTRGSREHWTASKRSLVGLLVWLLAFLPRRAWAHANLERADPAPGSQLDQTPRQLQLFFSEGRRRQLPVGSSC